MAAGRTRSRTSKKVYRKAECSFGQRQGGCIVTEIVVYPRVKAINIFLAGGELDQILDMDADVKAWAKDQGCTVAQMSGRLGWKKPLAPLGWELQHANFQKEI